jgi:acetyl esterase/lipase
MPLDPLFADRLHFFTKLPFADALAEYEAPVSAYNSPPIDTEEVVIDGPNGDIMARIYRPAGTDVSTAALPGLVWFHGGGFTQGNYDMNESDVVSREIAHRLKAVVMSVDYRLVTETVKFPVPQLDGISSTRWFAHRATQLGVNPNKIFVGGISAGGCLAASVAVIDRDSGDNFLAGQLLNCPIAHFVAPPFSDELQGKLDEDPKALVISREYLDDNNRVLVGGKSLEELEPYWFPGEVSDLSGLVPAQIINCEYDTLRASGEKFAEQLVAAGNSVEVLTQAGVPHAHINRYPADCKQMVETLDNMVRFMESTSKD